ncbi:MAG TPA: hypothetical protein DD658_08640, partial [Deltaproteobacteria bacterium]|nr:hypothetical protein [Deltaproteobacteria bacterium]
EGKPIHSKVVVFLLVLTLLSPAFHAEGSGQDCCGSAGCAATVPADLFGGAAFPIAAGSGNPCEGESQEGCSCESCQPLFAELFAGSGVSLPIMEFLGINNPSDPSATVSSEIFRPPLS